MSGCEKCHGTGTIPCSTCEGKKTEPCKKCSGKGKVICNECHGEGEVDCSSCDGSGKEIAICPVCHNGKVQKTRWIRCSTCYGRGYRVDTKYNAKYRCGSCGGSGQVEDVYYDICPNCHGDYKRKTGKKCETCGGTGKEACSRCGGKGQTKCQECGGAGKVRCETCHGIGNVSCPDCEKREREAKERRERKEREERNRRIEAREKKEAEEKAAQERKDFCVGCGCLLALVAIVGFLIWWWMEGFTMAGLSSIGTQIKNAFGGASGQAALGAWAKIGGVLVALLVGWKLIKGKKGEASTSTKKRWKFVVLGLLFGFLGVHLAYAKRWFLFLLLWAGLIMGGAASGNSSDTAKPSDETPAAQVEQSEAKSQNNGNIVENAGFGIWAFLWIGGILFIKKDGKGNRM